MTQYTKSVRLGCPCGAIANYVEQEYYVSIEHEKDVEEVSDVPQYVCPECGNTLIANKVLARCKEIVRRGRKFRYTED